MKQLMLTFVLFLLINISHGQVGIGTVNPHESAQLHVRATDKGFLPPQMSTLQKTSIVNPAPGLMVYDYEQQALNVYSELRGWEKVVTPSSGAYTLPTDITSNLPGAGNNYGFAVAINSAAGNNGMAVVGAPGATNREGLVDIFGYHASTGRMVKKQTMSPADLLPGDQFGYALALDRLNGSNDLVVAAPFSQENGLANAGSVYFFHNNSPRNQAFAPAGRQVANAKFGRSVDIAGNSTTGKGFAIVGAPGANANKGEAYIYEYNPNSITWDHRATLTDNQGLAADSFGFSVAIHYNIYADTGWAFVGAPYDDEAGVTDAGSVTAFRKTAGSALWTRVAKFSVATQDPLGGLYGYSLATLMNCAKLLVGAPYSRGKIYEASLTGVTGAGSIATFAQLQLPITTALGLSTVPSLGLSLSAMVDMDCNDIVAAAGAAGFLATGNNVAFGAVSTFHFDGTYWRISEGEMIDAHELQAGAGFGKAVSVSSLRKSVIVGAPNQNINGNVGQGKLQTRTVFQ